MKPKSTLFWLVFVLCANISITAKAQAVNVQDSLALVNLYDSTDGANWTNNTNWLTSNPVSTWFGITVPGARVTGINLDSNNLTGTLPHSLGNLTNLDSLKVFHNQLSGSIPSELGNLINLTYIRLSLNHLTGSIPPTFVNLTNLRILDMGGNQLSGNIPPDN